jgi:hypothetical protein
LASVIGLPGDSTTSGSGANMASPAESTVTSVWRPAPLQPISSAAQAASIMTGILVLMEILRTEVTMMSERTTAATRLT